jgi:hypothetical protein
MESFERMNEREMFITRLYRYNSALVMDLVARELRPVPAKSRCSIQKNGVIFREGAVLMRPDNHFERIARAKIAGNVDAELEEITPALAWLRSNVKTTRIACHVQNNNTGTCVLRLAGLVSIPSMGSLHKTFARM